MNRFDKPYISKNLLDRAYIFQPTIDKKKSLELFSIVSKLDTNELLQYSLINKISLDVTNENGDGLIHEVINFDLKKATQHNRLGVIKFLVQNGVHPDRLNKNNQSPLHFACEKQYDLIVNYLLQIGVNPDTQDNFGMTPFHYLLIGEIKLVEDIEIKDFIKSQRKTKFESSDEIKDIKRNLYQLIDNEIKNGNLPIFETIKNTINTTIENDDEIKNINNMFNDIIKDETNETIKNKENEYKKKGIKDKIEKLFGNFDKLDTIKIHKKTNLSEISDNNRAIIENGNNKEVIKKIIKDEGENIKKMNNEFNINVFNNNYSLDYILNENYLGGLNIIESKTKDYYYYDDKSIFPKEHYKEKNDIVRHHLALDNSSPIIDFENLKYAGVSKNIDINTQTPSDILKDFINFIKDDNKNNKIKFLLDDSINDKTKINYKFYISLAEHIILDEPLTMVDDTFFKKWHNIYKKNPNIASLIFNMYCDMNSNDDSLNCTISYKTLMLIAGLNNHIENNKINLVTSIINAYKPFLIGRLYNNININKDSIINSIILFLSNDTNTIIEIVNDKTINNDLSKKLNELFDNRENLCKFIINTYNDMNVKPMKQTLIDLIYIIKNYEKLEEFRYISLFNNDFKDIDESKKNYTIPSLNNNVDTTNSLDYKHFKIAYILGLYYEGLVYKTEINNNFNIEYKGKRLYMGHNISTKNSFSNFKFTGQLLLPLNYSINSHNNVYDINNITDANKIHIPTYYSYYLLLLNNITTYQKKIKELLSNINENVEKLLNGDTKDLNKLYTEYYYDIIKYSELLKTNINSITELLKETKLIKDNTKYNNYKYIDLSKKLNKINSSYYLYYYLFKPNKLIKLSKFNYYQLPIEEKESFQYFNTSENLININDNDFKDDSIPGDIETDEKRINKEEGFINRYNIGNYRNIYQNFKDNKLPNKIIIEKDYFKRLKTSPLPPSLKASLDDFYKYAITELIITIMKKDTDIKTILGKTNEYFNKRNIIKKEDILLYSKKLICDLINDIIYEYVKIFISNINKTNELNLPNNTDISLEKININLEDLKLITTGITNIYNIVLQPEKIDYFIIYPNDFTIINKYKSKMGININEKLIDILIQKCYNFTNNIDGQTALFNVVKNYNYKILEKIKKNDISINQSKLKDFINKEKENMVTKILSNCDKMNNILNNIDNFLYNDIKSILMSSETYGNNILEYLPISFHMSSYLTLQYLSDFNDNFKDEQKYLNKIINDNNIIDDNKILFINNIINSIKDDNYKKELKNINDEYKKNPKIFNIKSEEKGIIPYCYKLLFETKLEDNKDLKVFDYIEKQKLKELETISNNCENYFMIKKYTKDNKLLGFVKNMLEYITKEVICFGIEQFIRRILFTYYYEIYKLTKRGNIDYINKIIDSNIDTIKDLLYNDVCKKLVKNSSEIFEDKTDEENHTLESTKEILLELFKNLEEIPNEIKNILNRDVVNYFDSFVSRTILLWHVNFENILKYFINCYRCLKTFEIITS